VVSWHKHVEYPNEYEI